MSESRAIAAFTGLGVVLVGVALGVSHYAPHPSPVDLLPAVPTATAVVPPGLPPSAPGPMPPGARKMLQHPSLSRTQIAFDYAGEIWVVGREGGDARRLVTGQLRNAGPSSRPMARRSPSPGSTTATRTSTSYPPRAASRVASPTTPGRRGVGWTPDGAKVLLRSWRGDLARSAQALHRPVTGGFPEALPLPSGNEASLSPDGSHVAYIPYQQWQPGWKKYRGGQTTPIWIADLSDSHITKVPRTDSNDRYPMWVGDTVYFVSDRNGPYTLFAFDTKSAGGEGARPQPRRVRHPLRLRGPGRHRLRAARRAAPLRPRQRRDRTRARDDLGRPAAGAPPLRAHLPAAGAARGAVADRQARPVRVARRDPLGARREGRRAKPHAQPRRGRPRSGVVARRQVDRVAVRRVAASTPCTSGRPTGSARSKKVDLGDPPSYFYAPRWSPDSKKLALLGQAPQPLARRHRSPDAGRRSTPIASTARRFDVRRGRPTRAGSPTRSSCRPPARHRSSTRSTTRRSTQITDGTSDTGSPRFDRGGKYLWFLAQHRRRHRRQRRHDGDGAALDEQRLRASSCRRISASPVAPESDEEGDAGPGGSKDPREGQEGRRGTRRRTRPRAGGDKGDGQGRPSP